MKAILAGSCLALLMASVPQTASAWVGEVRSAEANGESIYALVMGGEGLLGAQAACEDLVLLGTADGEEVNLDGFNLLSVDTVDELNFVHDKVYSNPPEGLKTNTWTGTLNYEGAPELSGPYGFVFTENDAEVFHTSFMASHHAFVCEMVTGGGIDLADEPVPEDPTPTPGEDPGPAVTQLEDGTIYAYEGAHMPLLDAQGYCADLTVTIDDVEISGFSMVVHDSEDELVVVHDFIKANGFANTWAGTTSYEDGAVADENEGLVFVDYGDATDLASMPFFHNYAVVCER